MRLRTAMGFVLGLVAAFSSLSDAGGQTVRSAAHEAYAKALWRSIQDIGFQDWQTLEPAPHFVCGPPSNPHAKHFGKGFSDASNEPPKGAVVVTQHFAGDPPALTAVTVRLKRQPGYDARNKDWYWVHFSPDGKTIETSADKNPWSKRGFSVFEEEGRLWVFDADSPELPNYLRDGELAKHVIRPGVGPAGMTLKAPDADTITRYLVAQPGFVTRFADGRLWVFRSGCSELRDFEEHGELAKQVIRPGAGPDGLTLKAPDAETLDAYLRASGL